MNFDEGSGFGYDQISAPPHLQDSISMISSRNRMTSAVERRLNDEAVHAHRNFEARLNPDPMSRAGIMRNYINDRVKRELEQQSEPPHILHTFWPPREIAHIARPATSAVPTSTAPTSAAPTSAAPTSTGCGGCAEHKKNNMMLLFFIVLVVFCIQYSQIREMRRHIEQSRQVSGNQPV